MKKSQERSCRCIVLPLLLLSALVLLSVHVGFPSAFPDQKKKTHDGVSDSHDAIYDHVVDVAALTRSGKLEIGEEGLLSDSAEFRFNSSSYLAAECEGRRVYMHELPPEFNRGILSQCDAYEAYWLNFCDFAKNWGFGLKTHRRSKSWYRTEAYMLEIIFHERMKRYPCLAASAEEADAFYIPYYSGLDSLRFLFGNDVNQSHEHGVQLVEWLQANAGELWARNGGADHFVVMGRPAWDVSRALHRREGWGTSLLELPGLLNVTSLVLESRAFPWQEQAIPYPTSFHPAGGVNLHMWMSRVRRSRRTFLFSFAGGGGTGNSPNIRHSIRMECSDNPDRSSNPGCAFIDCEGNKCDHDPGYLMRRMMKADFCLQPPGDTPTRQSTFDGIVAGCIPVFFEKQGAYTQYTWHLPADPGDYSVLIPKDDVVFGDLKIGQILGNFSRQEIFRMRENVISLIPNVIYRNPEAASADEFRDAFDIAIDGVLQRVKNKNKSNPQTHSQL